MHTAYDLQNKKRYKFHLAAMPVNKDTTVCMDLVLGRCRVNTNSDHCIIAITQLRKVVLNNIQSGDN